MFTQPNTDSFLWSMPQTNQRALDVPSYPSHRCYTSRHISPGTLVLQLIGFSLIVGLVSSYILKTSQKRESSSLIFLYLLPKICIFQLGHSNLFWKAVKNSIHLFYFGGLWGLPDQQLIQKNTMKFSGKWKKMEKKLR